jgi:hypothetical protein
VSADSAGAACRIRPGRRQGRSILDRMPEMVESLRPQGEATDVVAHPGEPVTHVRGCRALDLILGRA